MSQLARALVVANIRRDPGRVRKVVR